MILTDKKTRIAAGPLLLLLVLALFLVLFLECYLYTVFPSYKKSREYPFAVSFYARKGEPIFNPDSPLKLAFAPYTIYKNLPNQKTENFTINSKGLRGREISLTPEGLDRIIVVGGSAAFGHGVPDDQTIASFLGRVDPQYEVINAGVIGFSSGQELAYVVEELVDYQPQVIIAYNGWNDLFSAWYYPREPGEFGYNSSIFFQFEQFLIENYRSQVFVTRAVRRLLKAIFGKSELLSFLKEELARRKQESGLLLSLPFTRKNYSQREVREYLEQAVERYVMNLKKMDDFCRQRRVRFLVVLQPELGLKSKKDEREVRFLAGWDKKIEKYSSSFSSAYRLFIRKSKRELQQKGIEFLDITDFPEFSENEKQIFIDAVHTNALGNEMIARLIRGKLNSL